MNEIEIIKSRIEALRETFATFTINNQTPYESYLEKLNALQARIFSLLNTLEGTKNEYTIEPYSCLTEADRIPNVYLRTRTLPAMETEEEELLAATGQDVEGEIAKWAEFSESIEEWAEVTSSEFVHNRRISANSDDEAISKEQLKRHASEAEMYENRAIHTLAATLSFITRGGTH